MNIKHLKKLFANCALAFLVMDLFICCTIPFNLAWIFLTAFVSLLVFREPKYSRVAYSYSWFMFLHLSVSVLFYVMPELQTDKNVLFASLCLLGAYCVMFVVCRFLYVIIDVHKCGVDRQAVIRVFKNYEKNIYGTVAICGITSVIYTLAFKSVLTGMVLTRLLCLEITIFIVAYYMAVVLMRRYLRAEVLSTIDKSTESTE